MSLTIGFVLMKLDKNGKLPWQTHPPSILVHQRHHAWSTFKSVKHRLGNRSAEASMAYKASATINNKYQNSAVQRKNPLHYGKKIKKILFLESDHIFLVHWVL